MKFEKLSDQPVAEIEQATSDYWKKINLLELTQTERSSDKEYVFYDGPPTANGTPGIHHVISRALKDTTCRYKTMKGYKVLRKAGWDTHGLPVEIEVEKQLGLKSKKEVEEYGIEAFNQKSRESVFKYEKQWREMSERMAYLLDMDDPYITLDNDYIESVWWLLKEMFDQGYIYEGAKILPYCGRCGTGLASHEVAQGYKDTSTISVTAAFKRKDAEDEYFLAWTTTPWTLPSNVALTVNPDFDYVLVASQGSKFYIEESFVNQYFTEGEFEIVKKVKGKDLEYMEYEQLLPFYEVDKKAFYITCGDYVTRDSGTGIVHTAPAFGEEDYQLGRQYGLPLINPVNDEGRFVGSPWDGQFVIDADEEIIQYLRDQGKLFKKEKITHNYPHCWRCDTPLIYRANPSWYIEVTKVKDQLIENNKGVNWYPAHVGEGRFGNWLENLKDWAISRSRFWGTPLNIWRCDACDQISSVGSRQELVERAVEDIDESIELHRPYVDDVHLTCDQCGGQMTRVPEVLDVWFDSGAMPFAQMHYPFENKETFFKDYFPADFICEGIDQTRGWFYSLLAISTLITGQAPYKNVLVNDLVLDKEGKKMSKSRGNTLSPFELFDQYGADVVRFYSIYVSPAWVPTRFDVEGLKEVESKFFRTIRNTYNFFQLYANTDQVHPDEFFIPEKERPVIDQWILSKYHSLLKSYEENMEIFEYTRVARDLSHFVIEDLSNWYIRRNRRRFWKEELDDDKKAVYNTTYEILLGLSKLIAPLTPFLAEELYHKLSDGKTVHLEAMPVADGALIQEDLEYKMDLVRDLVTLGRASREQAQIKVRQPLQKIIIDQKYEADLEGYQSLILEELNIKEIDFRSDLGEYMNYELKPNFRQVGQKLGKKIPAFQKYLQQVNEKDFIDQLNEEGELTLVLDGEEITITEEYVEIRVSAKEGFDVEMANNRYVILDTSLNEDLLNEGFMREFISKIQQLRRKEDLDLLDEIRISYQSTEKIQGVIKLYEDEIKKETLARQIVAEENLSGSIEDLNGQEAVIAIEKIS